MACSFPIKIKNIKYKTGGQSRAKWNTQEYFYVPCGKCLSCMISKRQWLSQACEYEFNKYGCGGFWTLTYDDENVNINENGQMVLNYRDIQLMFKRLRKSISDKTGINHDFKYLIVGEYGGQTKRPHWHLLTFGLDVRNNEYDIYKAWGKGEVKALPIKQGGINYVLKYMDKAQQNRKTKKEISEIMEKEEMPIIRYSKGMGKDWVYEHKDELIKNKGVYKYGKSVRTLPKYWCDKLRIRTMDNLDSAREEMWREGVRPKNKYTLINDYKCFSRNEVQKWLFEKGQIKEQELIKKSRDNGEPQEDFDELYSESIKKEIYN